MKTDLLSITDAFQSRKSILKETERFCQYYALTEKNAMHMHLLAEETFNIIYGIFEGFTGTFWLESTPSENGLLCRIFIDADVFVNNEQEDALRQFSTTGENSAARGIGGMIREIFRCYIQNAGPEFPMQWQTSEMMFNDGLLYNDIGAYYGWSLNTYRQNVVNEDSAKSSERCDELERSIIAKLADEVKIYIKTDCATVVIEKNLPGVS